MQLSHKLVTLGRFPIRKKATSSSANAMPSSSSSLSTGTKNWSCRMSATVKEWSVVCRECRYCRKSVVRLQILMGRVMSTQDDELVLLYKSRKATAKYLCRNLLWKSSVVKNCIGVSREYVIQRQMEGTFPQFTSSMRTYQMSVDSDKNLNSMYDLQKHLGEGCFGIIYRATNKTTNRECALKIEGFKHHAKQTLKKEYSMLKTLEGLDGVPAAYAFGRSDYFYLIQMQLLQTDLSFITQKNITLEPLRICRIGGHLLSILQGIHSRGVIHRDLKPQNIMLDDRSKLYIVDYGIAKRIDSHSDPNKKNNFVGTPRYASRNAHLGLKLGPLDDIESLLYILIFFIRRSLPWMHIAKEGNRKMDVIKKMKIQTPHLELCRDLPPCFLMAFQYIQTKPEAIDYSYLINLFRKFHTAPNISLTKSFGSSHSVSTNNSVSTSNSTLADPPINYEIILQLGLKLSKTNERRTSIQSSNLSNLLQVPSNFKSEVLSANSQMVIASIASRDEMGRLNEFCNENLSAEESVESRMQAMNKAVTKFPCL